MKRKDKMLKEIIKNKDIYPVYQPIISFADNSILGYEALSRIKDHDKYNLDIEEMFSLAENTGMVWELEELCRKKALKGAMNKPIQTKLFINVNPNVILDKHFESGVTAKFIKKYRLEPKDIVFEITERTPIRAHNVFKKTLNHYTSQGYKVAIDDFGSEYAGLNRLCYIKPEYLKLDIKLIRGIEKDIGKKSLVKHVIQFCKESSITTIAEGIETEQEAKILSDLGADYGQGYYYAKPQGHFEVTKEEINEEVYDEINDEKYDVLNDEIKEQIETDNNNLI